LPCGSITSGFAPPSRPTQIEAIQLAEDTLAVAPHHDHRLTRRNERFRVIARDAMQGQPFGIHGLCQRAGYHALKFTEVHDATMQLAMIATGMSVEALPVSMSRSAPAEVTFVPLTHEDPVRTLLLYDRRQVPVIVRELLRLIGRATITFQISHDHRSIGDNAL
jgi:DNA-binding transcriptional LysR family regulator